MYNELYNQWSITNVSLNPFQPEEIKLKTDSKYVWMTLSLGRRFRTVYSKDASNFNMLEFFKQMNTKILIHDV